MRWIVVALQCLLVMIVFGLALGAVEPMTWPAHAITLAMIAAVVVLIRRGLRTPAQRD